MERFVGYQQDSLLWNANVKTSARLLGVVCVTDRFTGTKNIFVGLGEIFPSNYHWLLKGLHSRLCLCVLHYACVAAILASSL